MSQKVHDLPKYIMVHIFIFVFLVASLKNSILEKYFLLQRLKLYSLMFNFFILKCYFLKGVLLIMNHLICVKLAT